MRLNDVFNLFKIGSYTIRVLNGVNNILFNLRKRNRQQGGTVDGNDILYADRAIRLRISVNNWDHITICRN